MCARILARARALNLISHLLMLKHPSMLDPYSGVSIHSSLCASVHLPCVFTLVLLEKPTHCGSALGFHNNILQYRCIFVNFMLFLHRNQKKTTHREN